MKVVGLENKENGLAQNQGPAKGGGHRITSST